MRRRKERKSGTKSAELTLVVVVHSSVARGHPAAPVAVIRPVGRRSGGRESVAGSVTVIPALPAVALTGRAAAAAARVEVVERGVVVEGLLGVVVVRVGEVGGRVVGGGGMVGGRRGRV